MNDLDIKRKLLNDLATNSFSIQEYIDYSNKFIRPEAEKKSYLSEMNIISETITSYIDSLKVKWNKCEDEIERIKLSNDIAKATMILGVYTRNFTDTIDIDYKNEIELEQSYYIKMKNGEVLTKDEIEELIRMYICGGICNKKNEYLDYIFKNLIEKEQVINEFLYKKIFFEKCKSILEKENIKDLNLQIEPNNDEEYGNYDFDSKTIFFSSGDLNSIDVIDNFVIFFHEKRHYYQINSREISLPNLTYAKDLMLGKLLREEDYYERNYEDLSFERDAMYYSYKSLFYLILEIAPSKLQEIKEYILKDLNFYKSKSSRDITERKKSNLNLINFNLLFERTVKKNKSIFMKSLINGEFPLVLLYEYDIRGNKKDLFELIEERDSLENKKENSSKIGLYDYLIHSEEVTLDYIINNLIKLSNDKYGKYTEEVREVLKERVYGYFLIKTQTSLNQYLRAHSEGTISKFYESIIKNLKSKNIQHFNENKDYTRYITREEELKACYKELSLIIEELEGFKDKNSKSI